VDGKRSQSSRGSRLAAIAGRQFGVVSIAQLYQLGFTHEEVRGMVKKGLLHRLYRGVYAVGHDNVPLRGQLLAASLALPGEPFLSHGTAAADRGLRSFDLHRIELTVRAKHTPRHKGLIVHRTTTPLDRSEVTKRSGLWVATVPRIMVDLARRETPTQLQELITNAVRCQQFDPDAVEAAITRHARRPGIAMLKAGVARYRPGHDGKSGLERSVAKWLRARPELPPWEQNIYLGIWEIDIAFSEQRVALELDGRQYHTAVEDFDKDRRKDTELQLMGWRPMRVSDFMWDYDHARVVRDLYGMLGITPIR
jgi:hypothetical protein